MIKFLVTDVWTDGVEYPLVEVEIHSDSHATSLRMTVDEARDMTMMVRMARDVLGLNMQVEDSVLSAHIVGRVSSKGEPT